MNSIVQKQAFSLGETGKLAKKELKSK